MRASEGVRKQQCGAGTRPRAAVSAGSVAPVCRQCEPSGPVLEEAGQWIYANEAVGLRLRWLGAALHSPHGPAATQLAPLSQSYYDSRTPRES